MNRSLRYLPLCTALLLMTQGCEKTSQGIVDYQGHPPFLRSATLLPDSVKLRSIVPANGVYAVAIDIHVEVAPFADPSTTMTLIAELLTAASDQVLAQVSLLDNGSGPDGVAGDNVYSGRLQFFVSLTDAGRFRVRIRGSDSGGFESNTIEKSFIVDRNNAPPVLSDLHAPDTVVLPPGDSVLIFMTVKGLDPDGQADIREVFFRSLDSSDPTNKYFLKDDGNADKLSGDKVAGDSVFSITIRLKDSPTVRKTYRFAFQAADTFGDTSATLLHQLVVQ